MYEYLQYGFIENAKQVIENASWCRTNGGGTSYAHIFDLDKKHIICRPNTVEEIIINLSEESFDNRTQGACPHCMKRIKRKLPKPEKQPDTYKQLLKVARNKGDIKIGVASLRLEIVNEMIDNPEHIRVMINSRGSKIVFHKDYVESECSFFKLNEETQTLTQYPNVKVVKNSGPALKCWKKCIRSALMKTQHNLTIYINAKR